MQQFLCFSVFFVHYLSNFCQLREKEGEKEGEKKGKWQKKQFQPANGM
jgi:hypothetical protein